MKPCEFLASGHHRTLGAWCHHLELVPKFFTHFPPSNLLSIVLKVGSTYSQASAFQSPKASTAQENKQMKEWLDLPPLPPSS